MPIIPAQGRLKQEDHKGSLGYIADPVSKTNKQCLLSDDQKVDLTTRNRGEGFISFTPVNILNSCNQSLVAEEWLYISWSLLEMSIAVSLGPSESWSAS
jgi:hypothetical protein